MGPADGDTSHGLFIRLSLGYTALVYYKDIHNSYVIKTRLAM